MCWRNSGITHILTSLILARLSLVSGSWGSCPVAPGGRWYWAKGKLLTSFPFWPILPFATFALSFKMSCFISSGRFCRVSFASNKAFSWSFLILARTLSSFPAEPESLLSWPVRVLVSTAEEWKKTPLSSLDESGKKKIAPKHRVIKALNTNNKINFSVNLKEVGLTDFLFGVAVKGRRVATGIFPLPSTTPTAQNGYKPSSSLTSGSISDYPVQRSMSKLYEPCQIENNSDKSSGEKLKSGAAVHTGDSLQTARVQPLAQETTVDGRDWQPRGANHFPRCEWWPRGRGRVQSAARYKEALTARWAPGFSKAFSRYCLYYAFDQNNCF